MQIRKLRLKDFRNYKNLELTFHPKVNLLLGNNAQGKTNLLEALYITSLGKSFRTGRDSEMIRFGAPFFRVEVEA
jgi:DNA replication and repair protein RecF